MQTRDQEEKPLTDEERIQLMLVHIADEVSEKLPDQIAKLALQICKYIPTHRALVADLLSKCIFNLPQKTSVYATVLALISYQKDDKGDDFAHEISSSVFTALQNALNSGDLLAAKLALRFFAHAAHVSFIEPQLLADLLKALLAEAQSSAATTLDFYPYLVVLTLPIAAPALVAGGAAPALKEITEACGKIIDARTCDWHASLAPLEAEGEERVTDHVQDCWSIVKAALEEEKFSNEVFFDARELLKAAAADKTANTLVRSLPKLDFVNRNALHCTLQSAPQLHLFAEKVRALYEGSALNVMLARELAGEMLNTYQHSQSLAGLHLGRQFAFAGAEHLLVEVLVQQMFALPGAICRPVFYAAVALTLHKRCKSESFDVLPVVAEMIQAVFAKLPRLDSELAERFVVFASFYLGSFDLKWEWSEWVEATDALERTHPQSRFLTALMAKLVALSYFKRVAEAVPPEMKRFMQEDRPDGVFPHADEKSMDHVDAALLLDKISGKDSCEALQTFLAEGAQLEATGEQLEAVFFECLLFKGQKSVEHFKKLIESYRPILETQVSADRSRQLRALGVLGQVWARNPQRLQLLAERCQTSHLVEPSAVVEWALGRVAGPEQAEAEDFSDHSLCRNEWEMIEDALQFALARTQAARVVLQYCEQENESDPSPENEVRLKELEKDLEGLFEKERVLFRELFAGFAKTLARLEQRKAKDVEMQAEDGKKTEEESKKAGDGFGGEWGAPSGGDEGGDWGAAMDEADKKPEPAKKERVPVEKLFEETERRLVQFGRRYRKEIVQFEAEIAKEFEESAPCAVDALKRVLVVK